MTAAASDTEMVKEYDSTRASLELLYHVSRELASSLDLRQVLTRILYLALDTVGGTSGSIIVLDDKGKPVDSAIIHTGQVYDQTTRQLRVTLEKGLAGWVAGKQEPALIIDTTQDERWLRRPDDSPDRTGSKSAVSAPLLVRDRLVGVITLVHPEPGNFNEEQLDLVQAIADQAGIAVLNARLYEESKRQARIMSALAESAAAINSALRLDDVLQRILEQTSQALQVEAVSLALLNTQTDELEYRAATGLASQEIVGIRLKVGQGVAGWVAREGRPLIVPQVGQDPHFYPDVDRRTGFETRSIACAPILSQGKVIGVVEAFNPSEGSFNQDSLLVLSGIGSLAGTAIHHANLFERLQAAHQRYRDLFENNIDPILITNWQGRIRGANTGAARTTDYPKETLLGMHIGELHQINETVLGRGFVNVIPDRPVQYKAALTNQTGKVIPVEVHVRVVDIDEIQRLQWIFRDRTSRERLERLREDLTSMIYHDLRAPLANIAYSLEALENMVLDEEDASVHSVIEVATRSTERIQRLTNSLLDIQSLEEGQAILEAQPQALVPLIEEAVETVQPVIESKEQHVRLDLEESLPAVNVDEDMIRRVLINLLDNAVKFTPGGQTITVGAESADDEVRVWVMDHGPGIPVEQQERLFQKFSRLQGRKTPGVGLGLAFCRLAVEAHDGRIWVESEPGEGARFTFTLPVAERPSSAGGTNDRDEERGGTQALGQ